MCLHKFVLRYKERVLLMKKLNSRMFIKLILSYLGMLLVPVVIAGGLYWQIRNVTIRQAETINHNLLVQIQQELDQEMRNIQKIQNRLALDENVNAIEENHSVFDARWSLYNLHNRLRMMILEETFLRDIFVYFPRIDKVCSSEGNMDLAMYYTLYCVKSGISLEDFKAALLNSHARRYFLCASGSEDDFMVFKMKTLHKNENGQGAVIAIRVDLQKIKQKLSFALWNHEVGIQLVDETEVLVNDNEDKNVFDASVRGDIVTSVESVVFPWYYEAIVPEQLIQKEVHSIQKWSVIALIVCCGTGFIFAIFFARKTYHPIRDLIEFFQNNRNVALEGAENEFQWLQGQVQNLLNEQIDSEKLLSESRKKLKTYYSMRLLLESCEDVSEVRSELDLKAQYFETIFLKINADDRQLLELKKYIIEALLRENILGDFEWFSCEMGEMVVLVVGFSEAQLEQQHRVQETLELFIQNMEESFKFECTALQGGICPGIAGIHESYLQAQSMEEYEHLFDTRVLCFEDIKDLRFQYSYPADMEERIINAVKLADYTLAERLMLEVFENNVQGKVKMNAYRCLIFEMTGTLLKGASAGGFYHAEEALEFFNTVSAKYPVEVNKQRFTDCLKQICEEIENIRDKANKDNSLGNKIFAFVRENYHNPDLNLSITSQHFRLTPSYLSALYKKQMGKSVVDDIMNLRLAEAEKLLGEGLNVAAVAEMSGFRDSASFIRCFKKKKGITPGQAKKENC